MIGFVFAVCLIAVRAVQGDVSHLGASSHGYSYKAPSVPLNYPSYPSNEYIPPSSNVQKEYITPVEQEYLPPAPVQQEYLPPAQVQQEYLPPAPVQQEYLPPVVVQQKEYHQTAPIRNEYIPPSQAPVSHVQHEYIPPPAPIQQEYISPVQEYVPPASNHHISGTYESQSNGYQYNVPLKRFRT